MGCSPAQREAIQPPSDRFLGFSRGSHPSPRTPLVHGRRCRVMQSGPVQPAGVRTTLAAALMRPEGSVLSESVLQQHGVPAVSCTVACAFKGALQELHADPVQIEKVGAFQSVYPPAGH